MAVSAELTEFVNDMTGEPAKLIPQQVKDRLVTKAVEGTYSLDRPRVLYVDLTPSGTDTVLLGATLTSALAVWGTVDSFVKDIEYPIGMQKPYLPMESDQWALNPEGVDAAQITGIVFGGGFIPQAAVSNIRVRYKTLHGAGTGSGVNETTVPKGDREAVGMWAISLVYLLLAGEKVGATASGMRADGVGWQSMATEYRSLAEAARKAYNQHMHPDETEIEAAMVSVRPRPLSSAGTPHLFEANRLRPRRRMP